MTGWNLDGQPCKYNSFECMGPGADSAWCCTNCQLDAEDFAMPYSPPKALSNISVFVYGSLMTGESLEQEMPAVGVVRSPARTRGRLHFAPGTQAFPVLVPTDDPTEWVYGELCSNVEPSDYKLEAVTLMEVTSGYDARWGLVENLQRDDAAVDVTALMFTWPWNEVGIRIPSGMWRVRNHG